MVVFKMRESVPTAKYSPVCNVLRQWKTSLILTYRVYRLYDSSSSSFLFSSGPIAIVSYLLTLVYMYIRSIF